MAATILTERAGGPRLSRNALVFVAPDAPRLDELRGAARSYLAWKSIWDEQAELNLDELSRRQAETQRNHFDETVNQRIGETFVWALVPSQDVGSDVTWEMIRVTGTEPVPVRVSKKLRDAELLITSLGGVRLRMELDRVPLWQGDHVGTQQLWSYFAQYLYLPRLRDKTVLVGAIDDGIAKVTWDQDTFAYADAFDEKAGRYVGLVAGAHAPVSIDSASVVIKSEVARDQMDETEETPPGGATPPPGGGGEQGEIEGIEPGQRAPRRFYGTVSVDPVRMSRDAGQIADEVVKHLVGLVDAAVAVRIEIEATNDEGFPDDVVRTVTENAKTLKFDQQGFEES